MWGFKEGVTKMKVVSACLLLGEGLMKRGER